MSESEVELLSDDVPRQTAEDDDSLHKNPIVRGWNRYAAEGYSLVNNNKPVRNQLTVAEGDGGADPKSSAKEKQLCTLLVLSVIVGICLIIVIIVISVKPPQTPETCQSPDCVMVAGSMLSKMQLSRDPCEDFYTYACNKAIHDPSIPHTVKKWGVMQQVEQQNMAIINALLEEPGNLYKGINSSAVEKAKSYYNACMNITARESQTNRPLLEVINSLGSWPLTNDSISGTWSSQNWSIEATLSHLFWYQTSALFTMTVGANDKNSSMQSILVDQGGTLLSDPHMYDANDSLPYHDAYIKFFVTVTMLLGANKTSSSAAAENVWQLEQALAKAFDKPEERIDPQQYFHLMTLKELQNLIGNDVIDMQKCLQDALNDRIPMTEEIVVYAVKYFPKMAALVKAADKETLSTYMGWHVVVSLLPYMPMSYRMALLEFQSVISGVMEQEESWKECVQATESALGYVTGALYVEENFSEKEKTDVISILSELRETLVGKFPTVTWMDDITRTRAITKANNIIEKIGYPEFIQDPVKLDDYYAKLMVNEDSAFQNNLNVRLFSAQRIVDKYGKPTDKSEWHMNPEEVNAYYSPFQNEIVFPAGILQKPLYDSTFPRSLLFGVIGMVMGHELSHAFDNQGRLFDVHGNLHNWWTNESAEAFLEKAQCFIEEYDKFSISGTPINGMSTLAENIADNAGLQTAYNAYKSWSYRVGYKELPLPGLNTTEDQLFFLGFAQLWCSYYTPEYAQSSIVTDSHANGKFRVIGTLQNMPEFSEAYQCTATSPMNPQNKCSLWW